MEGPGPASMMVSMLLVQPTRGRCRKQQKSDSPTHAVYMAPRSVGPLWLVSPTVAPEKTLGIIS